MKRYLGVALFIAVLLNGCGGGGVELTAFPNGQVLPVTSTSSATMQELAPVSPTPSTVSVPASGSVVAANPPVQCWNGSTANAVDACASLEDKVSVVSEGAASLASYRFIGLPSMAKLKAGSIRVSPVNGGVSFNLGLAATGVISANSLLSSSTYQYSGTLNFENAPSKIVSGQFSAFGQADSRVPQAPIAHSNCGVSSLAPQAGPTPVGEFLVYPNDCVISLGVGAQAWSAILAGNGYFDQINYAQQFSLAFKDAFDYLFIVLDLAQAPSSFEYSGVYMSLASRFPTRGRRLLGHITLPQLQASQGFANAIDGGPVLHELLHEWGNRGFIPNASDAGHWGFASVGGQLGGFKSGSLVSLGNGEYQAKGTGRTCLPNASVSELASCAERQSFGLFANGGNSIPYSSFELFAMGLVDASAVPDVQYAVGAKWADESAGKFSATAIRTVSAAQARAASNGVIPANLAGQKHFRVATLVLTPDVQLSASSLATLEKSLGNFEADGPTASNLVGNVVWFHNFFTATGGLARIRVGGLLAERR